MNPCQPHLWAMKWFMYSAQNEKARFEFDRAPMLAMRVQKSAPKHTMGQLRDIYAAAHAQQKLFATRRDNTRSMASLIPGNAETIELVPAEGGGPRSVGALPGPGRNHPDDLTVRSTAL